MGIRGQLMKILFVSRTRISRNQNSMPNFDDSECFGMASSPNFNIEFWWMDHFHQNLVPNLCENDHQFGCISQSSVLNFGEWSHS
jgi:hypothetical protein